MGRRGGRQPAAAAAAAFWGSRVQEVWDAVRAMRTGTSQFLPCPANSLGATLILRLQGWILRVVSKALWQRSVPLALITGEGSYFGWDSITPYAGEGTPNERHMSMAGLTLERRTRTVTTVIGARNTGNDARDGRATGLGSPTALLHS